MNKIYLAGPMRGILDDNYPLFIRVAAELRKNGGIVYNPAEYEYDRTVHKTFPLREAFASHCNFICLEADSIMLLPGWENSLGVSAELALAKNCELFVTEYLPAIF